MGGCCEEKSIKQKKPADNLQRQAIEDLDFVKINYDQITPLAERDYEGARDLARLKDIDAGNIGKLLFGPEVVGRFLQVTRYLKLARELFGDDKEKTVIKKTRQECNLPG